MKIRILEDVASENPAMPYHAGQVLDFPGPSKYILGLVRKGKAEVVKHEDERAVALPDEQPEPKVPPPQYTPRRSVKAPANVPMHKPKSKPHKKGRR